MECLVLRTLQLSPDPGTSQSIHWGGPDQDLTPLALCWYLCGRGAANKEKETTRNEGKNEPHMRYLSYSSQQQLPSHVLFFGYSARDAAAVVGGTFGASSAAILALFGEGTQWSYQAPSFNASTLPPPFPSFRNGRKRAEHIQKRTDKTITTTQQPKTTS